MTQEIEIEFKNLVTKADFERLMIAFTINPSELKTQINHYFDTDDFQLKTHGCALRIREKNGEYTLTLKQPNSIGLLETHQTIEKAIADEAFDNGTLPIGTVANQLLSSFQIKISDCCFLGSLTTKRAEKGYFGGTLVFDNSFYLDVEDYEIEYEVTNEHEGKQEFQKLFSEYNIPIIDTDNKVERFFNRKQAQPL